MRVLSLFSGVGAHDLGLEWAGYKIVGQVEIDEFCTKILEKHWPKVARWRDITSVTATDIRRRCGRIDLITGGFPCQDISTAGKQAGLIEGQRSSLYWEMWRLIKDLRPDWLLLENVPALRTKGSDNVLASLEALGYTCWPLVVGAVHAGAPHERKRVWIVAHSGVARLEAGRLQGRFETKDAKFTSSVTSAFNKAMGGGLQQALKPGLGRKVYGAARRLDKARLKALGNANPPAIPYLIGLAIMEAENDRRRTSRD